MQITSEKLKAWILTQDLNTEFEFIDDTDCICARFLKQNGYGSGVSCSPTTWHDFESGMRGTISEEVQDAINSRDGITTKTYLEVLEALS